MLWELHQAMLRGVKPLYGTELNKLIIHVITGTKHGFVVGMVDLRGPGLYFEVANTNR
jgi:hypothetical protein